MTKGYTMDVYGEKTARALGYELPISPKKSYEVCKAIRGMSVGKAIKYLEDVIAMKRAVPFRRYCKQVAHKKGIQGGGRYPIKVAKAILRLIKEAQANAEVKMLDPENMRLIQVAAHRGRLIKNRMPRAYGRSTPWYQQTTTIEVILEAKEE